MKAIPRVKMLGATSKEMHKNLIGERRKYLEKRKQYYTGVLQSRVDTLRVESKALDELKAAVAKRQKRFDEVKEYLHELRVTNGEEEVKKQELVRQLLNRNLEYKVFSGLEVILKLEDALKCLDSQSSSTPD